MYFVFSSVLSSYLNLPPPHEQKPLRHHWSSFIRVNRTRSSTYTKTNVPTQSKHFYITRHVNVKRVKETK